MMDTPDGTTKTCGQCSAPGSSFMCSKCKLVHYCDAVCQRKHWKTHKKACKDQELLYEITTIQGKGKGMIAKRKIAKGELIIEEKKLFEMQSPLVIPVTVMMEVDKLSEKEKKQFYELNDPRPDGIESMKAVRIYSNNCLPDGIFPVISRINHSCKPNALWSTDDDIKQEVRAITDIPAGQEITCSYLRQSEFYSYQERKEKLKNWNFDCSCEVCSLKGKELEYNEDVRRKIKMNHQNIESFVDRVAENPLGLARMRMQLKRAFNCAKENETAVEGLGIQCGAFSVKVSNQMHLLSMMARKINCKLEKAENPQVYKEKARQLGRQFGKMFESNVSTTEMEVDSLDM